MSLGGEVVFQCGLRRNNKLAVVPTLFAGGDWLIRAQTGANGMNSCLLPVRILKTPLEQIPCDPDYPAMIMNETLVLVDRHNRPIGEADKQTVHESGLRHRAFSIFLLDRCGRLLLQRRHASKYHSGGLWANACCGHPRPGERIIMAAQRRLQEELGASARLRFGFIACYHTTFSNGLRENEVVYVYFGRVEGRVSPNPAEVDSLSAVAISRIRRDVRMRPEAYAFWFRHYLARHGRRIDACLLEVAAGGEKTR